MRSGTSIPRLRLVSAPRGEDATSLRNLNTPPVPRIHADDVAPLSALDARWMLAGDVVREIGGGRDAAIGPASRARLVAIGKSLGLRPFDANLVIAVIQDAVRHGEDPLGRVAEGRLRLVRPPMRRAAVSATAALVTACMLGAAMSAAAILWMTAG